MTAPYPRETPHRVIRSEFGLSFAKIGATRYDLSDPYHLALTVRWPTFVLGLFTLYGLITSVFAVLYLLQPGCVANARAGSLLDTFFFSIETLATVGYGEMAPATLYGHLVSSAEIITGMAFTAIMTGLVFVRFSKAKARIVYADEGVITHHNGRPTLMLRVGNARTTVLTQVEVQLSALVRETTTEGHSYRRINDLALTQARMPMFPLMLTLMHEIDEHSPLAPFAEHGLAESGALLILSLEARDPELAATVYDLKTYAAAKIRYGMRFADAVSQHADGYVIADLTRIGDLEPDHVRAT